jgi:hypothetical protein
MQTEFRGPTLEFPNKNGHPDETVLDNPSDSSDESIDLQEKFMNAQKESLCE